MALPYIEGLVGLTRLPKKLENWGKRNTKGPTSFYMMVTIRLFDLR